MRDSTKQLVIEKAFQLEIEELLKYQAEYPHESGVSVAWEPGAVFCYLYETAEAMEHSVDLLRKPALNFGRVESLQRNMSSPAFWLTKF